MNATASGSAVPGGAGKGKVHVSADTERGEAGVSITKGIGGKSNLAMAGSNILGDKSSFLKQKGGDSGAQTVAYQ